VRYVYDGDGNRVAKTVNGVTTRYLVDTSNPTGYAQVVEEIIGGNVKRTYPYGLMRISQRQLISGNWMASFYSYDGHGSVRLLTDANGSVVDTFTYDAFGILINRTGTTPNDYLYAGEQLDPNLGFYYLRARYMNPASGRLWTMDDYEGNNADPASLHKYIYTNNDPVNGRDPSGNLTVKETLFVASIIVTIASFLFQTARVAAPGNDPIENEYYRAQADLEEAEIRLAFLILSLATISVGAVARTGASGASATIGSGGKGVRVPPFNPSEDPANNCTACVAAYIKTSITKVFTTADDIISQQGLPELDSVGKAVRYITQATGTRATPSGAFDK
jgi:RHS repeat-associated protein